MSDQLRRYELFGCPVCGKQIQRGTESCMGVDALTHANTHAAPVTAIDERDVQPLVKALEIILREANPGGYIEELAADALAPFSTRSEEKQR